MQYCEEEKHNNLVFQLFQAYFYSLLLEPAFYAKEEVMWTPTTWIFGTNNTSLDLPEEQVPYKLEPG